MRLNEFMTKSTNHNKTSTEGLYIMSKTCNSMVYAVRRFIVWVSGGYFPYIIYYGNSKLRSEKKNLDTKRAISPIKNNGL